MIVERRESWEEIRAAFRWRVPARYNIAEHACERHVGSRRPAMICPDPAGGEPRLWSFRQLSRLSNRLANALAAAGVGRGDRVAVLLGQGVETGLAHLAACKLGAVALPLFTLFRRLLKAFPGGPAGPSRNGAKPYRVDNDNPISSPRTPPPPDSRILEQFRAARFENGIRDSRRFLMRKLFGHRPDIRDCSHHAQQWTFFSQNMGIQTCVKGAVELHYHCGFLKHKIVVHDCHEKPYASQIAIRKLVKIIMIPVGVLEEILWRMECPKYLFLVFQLDLSLDFFCS